MSTTVPMVSVLMPVRNEGAAVADAVRSVLRQRVNCEVLVIDGDSTDDTVAQVQQLAAADDRVRLVRNPQRTIPHALNAGAAVARGQYLARVDGHASINPSYLSCALDWLQEQPQLAAVGGRRIGVARTPWGAAVATALSSRFGVGDSINHYATAAQVTDHASFGVFRAEAVRAIGGWDAALAVNEDVDLDYRLQRAGHALWFDPAMHIYWQVRETWADFARQYRRYGRGKAAMIRKNGWRALSVRHLVPPALVMTLVGAMVAALAGWWPIALALVLPYAVAVTVATVLTWRSRHEVSPPPMQAQLSAGKGQDSFPVGSSAGTGGPGVLTQVADIQAGDAVQVLLGPGRRADPARLAACFVAMHVGWGWGFAEGLLFGLVPADASTRFRH